MVSKRLVAALAIVAATVLGGVALASPAQAGPAQEHYAILVKNGPAYDDWFYVDPEYRIIGCPKCFLLFYFAPPEEHPEWQGGLMEGLDQLSQASVASDERTAAALRAAAMDSFTGAARNLSGATLRPGPASAHDPSTGRTFPIDAPWLDAAQADIAAGMDALQQSFSEPWPLPWRQLAAHLFDQAFTEIATKKAI
jgi:hypothetical protein